MKECANKESLTESPVCWIGITFIEFDSTPQNHCNT